MRKITIRNDFKKEEILKFAKFMGLGFYRVDEEGKFVECDVIAREIFGIPQKEKNISVYSIKDFYVVPIERDRRVSKLLENKFEPVCNTLSIRINNENILLFDMCWYDDSYKDQGNVVGLISKIEESTIFPKMFETFPMGLYELDEKNRIVKVNKEMLEIFKCKNEDQILSKNIEHFYEDAKDFKEFTCKIQKKGYAHDILKLKAINKETLDIECFSQMIINPYKKAFWGTMVDVTKRERYYRSLDSMPTGYYYIENGCINQCNDQFARIMGFENAKDAIGISLSELSKPDTETERRFFKNLSEADRKGKPLQNYLTETRNTRDERIHISIDAHLVRDHNGRVIGREGTIRDITERVKLEEKVKDTEKRLSEMTADLNNLIHTFLHPVLKFSGHSELFHQLGEILFKSLRHKTLRKTNIRKLGESLGNRLIHIKNGLRNISDISESATVLTTKIEKIIIVFEYNLKKADGSKILADKAIRDTALWMLEELEQIGFFNENIKKGKLIDVISEEFIVYLQNILFDYLIRTARILQGETHVMRREVEALRRYIEVGKKRIYNFKRANLGKILEENIEIFKPIIAQKDIGLEFTPPIRIEAMISENDIDRVICNLLHNANKYSYNSFDQGRSVVKIKTRDLQQENAVEFSISSYGIPIKKEEIKSGDIFQFGYRSQLAYKTDRDGSGVGLADAKDVIEQHGGKITITSEPEKDDGDPPQYKARYITRVTVRLPKNRDKKGVKNGIQSLKDEKIIMD